MTKKVRIENADTSNYKVKVFVEDLVEGQWVRNPTPIDLDFPTMLTDGYIHSSRRLVVEEG